MTRPKSRGKTRNISHGATTRLSEEQLHVMGDLFPGFDTWYRSTHDENGKVLPGSLMPGLTQRQYEGSAGPDSSDEDDGTDRGD